MIARNTTINDLYKALEAVNKKYDNNLKFKREPEAISGNAQRFTLTIVDSHKAGGRLGPAT